MLSAEETDRYDRQLIMENIGQEGQEKLKQAKVFLAGAGGLGSPIAMYLAAAGIGKIRIVDNGFVETSNLNRQILYRPEDLDQAKAVCAKKRLKRFNPNIEAEAILETIRVENAQRMVGQCDIIIDALDNYAARYILNQVAFQKGIPMVHGAVEEFFGQATTIVPGKTNCLKCLFPQAPPHQTWPIIGVTCGLIASIQAAEVIKIILGIGSPLENRLLIWDGLQTRMEEITLERHTQCDICGKL